MAQTLTRYLRQPELLGQPEVTPEQAAANRAAGKSPRRPQPAIPGRVPISASTLWRRVGDGSFPKPVRLSGHVVAWDERDVIAWQQRQRTSAPA